MGTLKARDIQQKLIENGRSPLTPIAVIARGTRADQKVLSGTLSELDALAKQAPTPALLVIGEVAALHERLHWFGERTAAESAQPSWSSAVNLA